MPHDLYTPQQAARSTLAMLRYLSVLPRTVNQDFSEEFVAGRGRTVDVPLPVSVGTARTYTAENRAARDQIVFDDLAQETIPVTISDQVYKAVRLPDDFATFDLQTMEGQVLRPQAESVVDGITAPLTAQFGAVDIDADAPSLAGDGSNALDTLIGLREVLNSRTRSGKRAPATGRFVAVGARAESALLKVPQLQKVNESGDGGTMLREATIGRLMGFTIVSDPNLDADDVVAYHRDAFVHVTRPSRPPEGAAASAIIAQDGFALRWLRHYNPLHFEDQSVVDAFVAAKTVIPEWAVRTTVA